MFSQAGDSRHTPNIQINKVIGENEKYVLYFTEKSKWTFWPAQQFPEPSECEEGGVFQQSLTSSPAPLPSCGTQFCLPSGSVVQRDSLRDYVPLLLSVSFLLAFADKTPGLNHPGRDLNTIIHIHASITTGTLFNPNNHDWPLISAQLLLFSSNSGSSDGSGCLICCSGMESSIYPFRAGGLFKIFPNVIYHLISCIPQCSVT